MFRVSGQEQELLLNRTARLPNDPDGYIITLTVFHSLHCLVSQRCKTIHAAGLTLTLELPPKISLSRVLPR